MRAQEYVTDVTYVRGFEKNLSPDRLRLCAALNGFAAPALESFDYCELGCAHGDTTVALAATFPNARFVGVDLNAEHIALANALASSGRVGNVKFLERDFEGLEREDLPSFDYIVAHGVLSWVGPHKRKAVLDFMSKKLKPGGFAYVSYNALPGWASVEPLRQLILARAALAPGDSLEGARLGLEFAKLLDGAGAFYFQSNPAAKAMLKTMEEVGLHYVVHEYLHAHWVPMYFAQLASEMAAHDLYFVGQLPVYLNYRDLAIPTSLHSLFANVNDRVAFEGLKDFALNTYFRADVFVKGRVGRADSVTHAYLDTTPFGTIATPEEANGREVALPNHTLRFAGPIFDSLLPILETHAETVASLAARPELADAGADRVREALVSLLLGERAVPMRRATSPADARGTLAIPSPYNRFILERGFSGDLPVVLAAPALGNGLQVSAIDAIAIVALLEIAAEQRESWVRSFSREHLLELKIPGRTVTDSAEIAAIVLDHVARFAASRLPKLVELGIVAPAAK